MRRTLLLFLCLMPSIAVAQPSASDIRMGNDYWATQRRQDIRDRFNSMDRARESSVRLEDAGRRAQDVRRNEQFERLEADIQSRRASSSPNYMSGNAPKGSCNEKLNNQANVIALQRREIAELRARLAKLGSP